MYIKKEDFPVLETITKPKNFYLIDQIFLTMITPRGYIK